MQNNQVIEPPISTNGAAIGHRLTRSFNRAVTYSSAAIVGAVLTLVLPSAVAGANTSDAESKTPPTSAECVKTFGVSCYSPSQLQRAYDLTPLYGKGFDGKGRTIVIVDPYGSPTLRKDLATFDRALGVSAPPSLRIIQPVGKVPAFDPTNSEMVSKAGETTGDVETAHEIAPGAAIVVIETPTSETLTGGGFSKFIAADDYAAKRHLGDVISQSYGLPEQDFKKSTLMTLRHAFVDDEQAGITVLAASNDLGVTRARPRLENCSITRSSTGPLPIPSSPVLAAPRCTSTRPVRRLPLTQPGMTVAIVQWRSSRARSRGRVAADSRLSSTDRRTKTRWRPSSVGIAEYPMSP